MVRRVFSPFVVHPCATHSFPTLTNSLPIFRFMGACGSKQVPPKVLPGTKPSEPQAVPSEPQAALSEHKDSLLSQLLECVSNLDREFTQLAIDARTLPKGTAENVSVVISLLGSMLPKINDLVTKAKMIYLRHEMMVRGLQTKPIVPALFATIVSEQLKIEARDIAELQSDLV